MLAHFYVLEKRVACLIVVMHVAHFRQARNAGTEMGHGRRFSGGNTTNVAKIHASRITLTLSRSEDILTTFSGSHFSGWPFILVFFGLRSY